ncbi:MAG: FixH family protein [Betaproteobacteria bacterium]|nr:FixH family protein [Betaproteobacteria bacterium]
MSCRPAGERLVYDCRIRLSEAGSGNPLNGASVSVGADMPSMPMAHNAHPVAAKPAGEPGSYRARLRLEMPGEWALRIRVSGPVRDQLRQVQRFE